jgi:metal-responsive CopG/Arc/MetJ family transcriptional regulator
MRYTLIMSDAAQTEPKDQRVVMMMTRSELKAVDDWSFEHRIRSRGEAIRQLIALGLKASEQQATEESAASVLAREEGLPLSKRKGKV